MKMRLPNLPSGLHSVLPRYNANPGGRGRVTVNAPKPKPQATSVNINVVQVPSYPAFPYLYAEGENPIEFEGKIQGMLRALVKTKGVPNFLLLNSAPRFVIEPRDYHKARGSEYWIAHPNEKHADTGVNPKEIPTGWDPWSFRRAKRIIKKLEPYYNVKQEPVEALTREDKDLARFAIRNTKPEETFTIGSFSYKGRKIPPTSVTSSDLEKAVIRRVMKDKTPEEQAKAREWHDNYMKEQFEKASKVVPFPAVRYVLERKAPIALNVKGGAAINEKGVVTDVYPDTETITEQEAESLYENLNKPFIREKAAKYPEPYINPTVLVEPKVYMARGRLFSNETPYQGAKGFFAIPVSKKESIEKIIEHPISNPDKPSKNYISMLPNEPKAYTAYIIAGNARGEVSVRLPSTANKYDKKGRGSINWLSSYYTRSGGGTKTLTALFEKYPDATFNLSSELPAYRFWKAQGARAEPYQQDNIRRALGKNAEYGSSHVEMTLNKKNFDNAQDKKMFEQISIQSKQPVPIHYGGDYSEKRGGYPRVPHYREGITPGIRYESRRRQEKYKQDMATNRTYPGLYMPDNPKEYFDSISMKYMSKPSKLPKDLSFEPSAEELEMPISAAKEYEYKMESPLTREIEPSTKKPEAEIKYAKSERETVEKEAEELVKGLEATTKQTSKQD